MIWFPNYLLKCLQTHFVYFRKRFQTQWLRQHNSIIIGFLVIGVWSGDWVAIFNKKNDGWGAYSYSEADDALRVNLKPEFVGDVQEQLMYAVDNSGIVFAWDKARLHLSVE